MVHITFRAISGTAESVRIVDKLRIHYKGVNEKEIVFVVKRIGNYKNWKWTTFIVPSLVDS